MDEYTGTQIGQLSGISAVVGLILMVVLFLARKYKVFTFPAILVLAPVAVVMIIATLDAYVF